jgi:DNA-binding transcriptional LysR family regulator
MDLRVLRYFLAVADEQSFSAAAKKLHMAQPPLSQQIKHLEEELGVQLFERQNRPVRLTPAGAFLASHGRSLIDKADELVEYVKRMGNGERGVLNVGFVGSATFEILPKVLQEFRKRSPEVLLNLHEMSSVEQQRALNESRIDVGFMRPLVPDDSFKLEKIYEEPLVVAVPTKSDLARLESVSLKELEKESFIWFPRSSPFSYGGFILNLCRSVGFEPRIVQETSEMQTALSLIAGGIGLGLVPYSARNVRRGGVVFLPFRSPVLTTAITVAYKKAEQSPTLKIFLEAMRSVLKKEKETPR